MTFLERRRAETRRRLDELPSHLEELERLLGHQGCLYVTGSFGRGDAGAHSDLDAFVVIEGEAPVPDHTRIESLLRDATQAMGIEPFKAKVEHPVIHRMDDLVKEIGSEHDDAKNTFTARLLLLLESQPVLGVEVYERARDRVIDAYWLDYDEHVDEFLPGFLANDILRMWRTFCVNYEARTRREPDDKLAARKVKNFKLKHSRLLTCYSALVRMMLVFRDKGTVTPARMRAIVDESPTHRLEQISEPALAAHARDVLARYEAFLGDTDMPTSEFEKKVLEGEKLTAQNELGDRMFGLLSELGHDPRAASFFRLLVV